MPVQKKRYSWKLEAKTEGTNGFQNFMSAVYSTKQTYLKGTIYTKGFASEESAARTSFHRKTCKHSRWYLLFLLPSPNLDAGLIFQWIHVILYQGVFCRKPVLFPSIESRVPVNAPFNGRTFCTKGRSIWQTLTNLSSANNSLFNENAFVVCLCSNSGCKGSTMSYGKTEDLWLQQKKHFGETAVAKRRTSGPIWT